MRLKFTGSPSTRRTQGSSRRFRGECARDYFLIIYILLSHRFIGNFFQCQLIRFFSTQVCVFSYLIKTSYLIKNIINCEKNLICQRYVFNFDRELKKTLLLPTHVCLKNIINAVFALVTEIPTALEEPWECWLGGCRDGRRDILSGNTKLSSYSRSIFVWKKNCFTCFKISKKEIYYYPKLYHINVLFFSILYIYALLLCQQKTYLFSSSHRKSVSFN